MGFGIYTVYRWVQPDLRRRRMQLFLDSFRPDAATRILDVGGYVADWDGVVPITSKITLLNLEHPPAAGPVPDRFQCDVGDGRRMGYRDGQFDIAFSNSVIEHLRTIEDQRRFAAEVRRTGRQLFVQTPNRWFFIEPHFVSPFVHYLPWKIARRLIRFCSVRGWFRSGDNVDLKELADELRLLTHREVRQLFPDCEIHREKWFGLTKSFIAIRRLPSQPA
jgi:hypothetical protein